MFPNIKKKRKEKKKDEKPAESSGGKKKKKKEITGAPWSPATYAELQRARL